VIPYVHVGVLRLGPLPIQPFGVLVALGVILGISLANWRGRQLGVDANQLQSFIKWFLIAGFVGGHVLDALLYHPSEVFRHPAILFALWQGLSSFGGFFGAVLGAVAWKYYDTREVMHWGRHLSVVRPVRRAKPASILPYADVVLAVFPVAWVFGRAGCAVVHDHPGVRVASGSWLSVAYGPGPVDTFGFIELRHGTEPRYDLGLLEMMFACVVATAFATTWRRRGAPGWYVVASCILYAPVRFGLDFLRLDDLAGGDERYAGLTPAQWACLGLFLFGVAMAARLVACVRRRTRLAASPREE
jgi:phosphatidylglycerol---prolipoprotein diacylglyceryl transferase